MIAALNKRINLDDFVVKSTLTMSFYEICKMP